MGAILASTRNNLYPGVITSIPVSSVSGAVIHVSSNSSGYSAGISDVVGGPFDSSSIYIPAGSATIYLYAGAPESTGSVALVDLADGGVATILFSILPENSTTAKVHSESIYDAVSSFFDLFEDRDYLLRYWNTWQLTDDDMASTVRDADINDNILEMNAFNTRRHMVFAFDYRDAQVGTADFPYQFELPILVESIPTMSDMVIKSNKSTMYEGVDYEIVTTSSASYINFKLLPARSGEILTYYCKTVKIDVSAPRNNFGVLLGMEDYSSESYLAALRALWYAYWNGPSPDNIANAVSVACGIPVSQDQAVVLSITGTELTLSNGQTVEIPSGVYPIVQQGQLVAPFKALLDGVAVSDRTTPGRYLDKLYMRTLFRLFGYPTIYDALVGLYGETKANEWVKANLQWHVHLIEVDLDKVLKMEKFYGAVLASLITKFRPKQDFAIAIFRGTIQSDEFIINEALDARGTFDIRYTVERNPASHFNTGLSPTQDDYRNDLTGYAWANIDAQVFAIEDDLYIYPVSAGVSGSIPLYPAGRVYMAGGVSYGYASVSADASGGHAEPLYGSGWVLGVGWGEGNGILIGSNVIEKFPHVGEEDP